jgi:hypothetical protein
MTNKKSLERGSGDVATEFAKANEQRNNSKPASKAGRCWLVGSTAMAKQHH